MPRAEVRTNVIKAARVAPAEKVTTIVRSPWYSPAGKKQMLKQLLPLLPQHHTYVEPFAGSGAVFFGKARSPREVVNDLNPKVSQAFSDLKALTKSEVAALEGRVWKGSRKLYLRLLKSDPQNRVDRFYKFMYISIFSYGHKWGAGFNPGAEGQSTGLVKRVAAANDRMRGVIVRNGTYVPLMSQFDGPSSFFFLDPPYRGTDVAVGESKFDEVEFKKILDGLKGRFLVTYGTTGQLKTDGFRVKRVTPPRSIRHMRGAAKHKTLPTLLISNYELTAKSMAGVAEDAWEFEDAEHIVSVNKSQVRVLCAMDADHLMKRLKGGYKAGVLTAAPRLDTGSDRVLITEPNGSADPMGVGVVRMGKAIALTSIDSLPDDMRAGIGDRALRDFTIRESLGDGPFYYQPLMLVAKFDEPRPIEYGDPAPPVPAEEACYKCGVEAEVEIEFAETGNTVKTCKRHERVARGMALLGDDRVAKVTAIERKDEEPKEARVKIDETENEFRVRVVEPSEFDSDSFRRIPLKADKPRVFGVVGRKQGESTTTLQSLRFPKEDGWTESQVQEWMKAHPDLSKLEEELDKLANPDRLVKLLCKADGEDEGEKEERFILGIVLEPEVRDSQGDIYSAEEVKQAAHDFLVNSRQVGLMHKKMLKQEARVVESYIAPADMQVGGQQVKKGTWIMGIHVVDDKIWADVKAGRLTGLSIGGSALRVPDRSAA